MKATVARYKAEQFILTNLERVKREGKTLTIKFSYARVFRHYDEHFELIFCDQRNLFTESTGLRIILSMIMNPGKFVTFNQLYQKLPKPVATPSVDSYQQLHLKSHKDLSITKSIDSLQYITDEKTYRTYRSLIKKVDGDPMLYHEHLDKIEVLRKEISFFGRKRTFNSSEKRINDSVRKNIKSALSEIKRKNPAFHFHLTEALILQNNSAFYFPQAFQWVNS